MEKQQDITPDSLASKAFVVTMIGTALYIGVVFVFVIGGNKDIQTSQPGHDPHGEHAAQAVHAAQAEHAHREPGHD